MKNLIVGLFFIVFAELIYGQPASVPAESISKYFKEHIDSLNPIEGKWDVTSTLEYYHHDTLYDVVKTPEPLSIAVMKKEEKFQSYIITGSPYEVEFTPTDVKGVYLYRIYFPQANLYSGTQAVISKSGEMEYTYDFPDWYFGIKPGAHQNEGLRVVNVLKWKKHPTQSKN